MGTTARRDAGAGSVYQRHDHPTCPPAETVIGANGEPRKVRPKHKPCLGTWCATVELGWEKSKRRRKIISGKTKADVVEKLKKIRKEHDATGTVAVNVPTVATWLRRWLNTVMVNRLVPKSLTSYESEVEKHIVPFLGHIKVNKLTVDHVLQWHEKLRNEPVARPPRDADGNPIPKTMAESSVLKAHAVLSRALEDAVPRGYAARNVAKLIDRPGGPTGDVKHLNVDQALIFLRNVADDPLGSRWGMAFMTAARQGECLGLTRELVYLDKGLADISWQVQRLPYEHGCEGTCGRRYAGDCPDKQLKVRATYEHHVLDGALALTRPKGAKRRITPLAPPLVAWIRRRIDETDPGPHDLVWHRDGGRPVDPRQDYARWLQLLAECNLPRIKLHSARHSAVSLLLALDVQEAVIMQIAGHSTVAAQRRYQHLDQKAALAAAELLGGVLAIEPAEKPVE